MPPCRQQFRAEARQLNRLLLLVCATIASTLSGCSKTVGDSCGTNLDCSPFGDMICDTSQPDGYCTVVGCGATTCIDEATCVSFFPEDFLQHACSPTTEDAVDPAVIPTNDCTPDEICLTIGLCATRSLERRFCMKPCTLDSGCRPGYVCRQPGDEGSQPVIDLNNPEAELKSFCGPAGSSE